MNGDRGTRVLVVDGDEAYATRTAESLSLVGDGFEGVAETDPSTALTLLESGRFDCVVCGDLAGDDPVSLVAAVESARSNVATLVLTADGSEAMAAETLRSGADDYRRKDALDGPETLASWVRGAVERAGRADGDRFLRMATHDLRNPLVVARGWLDLYHDDGDESQYEQVREALDRMEAILDDVAELARTDDAAATREAVDLSAVATAAWDIVAPDDAELTAEYGSRIEADASMLQAVLENLFDNAATHGVPDGEAVSVRVGTLPDGEGFYVADDGRGIPPTERERVFERGHSDGQGTGMGLAIVSCIADAHDWTVALTDGAAYVAEGAPGPAGGASHGHEGRGTVAEHDGGQASTRGTCFEFRGVSVLE